MIFDKQSFLAGLHTGLRLGRDPIGRRPPPPQKRYIIQEDGMKILFTEVKSSAGATIYGMSEEYNAIYYSTYTTEGEIVDTGVMHWYRSVYRDGKFEEAESTARAILVYSKQFGSYYWVLFSDNRKDFVPIPDLPADQVTYVLSMTLDGDGRKVGGSVAGVGCDTTPDGYYYSLSFVDWQTVGRVRPEGDAPLILDSGVNIRQAIEDFVDSYFDESEPMITEEY